MLSSVAASRLAAEAAGPKDLILIFFLVLCVATAEIQPRKMIPHKDDYHQHQHHCGFRFEANTKNGSWESEYATYLKELKAMQAGNEPVQLGKIQQDNKAFNNNALSPWVAVHDGSNDPYDPCENLPPGYSFFYEP